MTRAAVRAVALRVGLVALAVVGLAATRPGVLVNGVRSPRVWLVVVLVLVASRLLALGVTRATGRPRLGSAAAAVAAVAAVALLLAPSFRQRTVVETDPFAVAMAAPSQAGPEAASDPASVPASGAPDVVGTVLEGRLRGIGHRAQGRVQVQVRDGVAVLRFLEVDIEGTPGPEVHLVPRGASGPDGGVPLGALTAERGSFSYRLPAGWDAAGDVDLLVWCAPFDTPVAGADLR